MSTIIKLKARINVDARKSGSAKRIICLPAPPPKPRDGHKTIIRVPPAMPLATMKPKKSANQTAASAHCARVKPSTDSLSAESKQLRSLKEALAPHRRLATAPAVNIQANTNDQTDAALGTYPIPGAAGLTGGTITGTCVALVKKRVRQQFHMATFALSAAADGICRVEGTLPARRPQDLTLFNPNLFDDELRRAFMGLLSTLQTNKPPLVYAVGFKTDVGRAEYFVPDLTLDAFPRGYGNGCAGAGDELPYDIIFLPGDWSASRGDIHSAIIRVAELVTTYGLPGSQHEAQMTNALMMLGPVPGANWT